eukprot:352161-Chlamydomonas_euryale.AAC.2
MLSHGQSQSYREHTHEGYACVERSKTVGIGPTLGVHTLGVRVRVTGSRPMKGMPVLSAARQREIDPTL